MSVTSRKLDLGTKLLDDVSGESVRRVEVVQVAWRGESRVQEVREVELRSQVLLFGFDWSEARRRERKRNVRHGQKVGELHWFGLVLVDVLGLDDTTAESGHVLVEVLAKVLAS